MEDLVALFLLVPQESIQQRSQVLLRSDFLRAWSSSSILRGIMEAIQLVPKSAFATRSGAVFMPVEAIQLVLRNAFVTHSGADPSYSRLRSKSWKSSLELW